MTERPLKFWSVYSYLVVYDPAGDPSTIVAVLHGTRDVAQILKEIGGIGLSLCSIGTR